MDCYTALHCSGFLIALAGTWKRGALQINQESSTKPVSRRALYQTSNFALLYLVFKTRRGITTYYTADPLCKYGFGGLIGCASMSRILLKSDCVAHS